MSAVPVARPFGSPGAASIKTSLAMPGTLSTDCYAVHVRAFWHDAREKRRSRVSFHGMFSASSEIRMSRRAGQATLVFPVRRELSRY